MKTCVLGTPSKQKQQQQKELLFWYYIYINFVYQNMNTETTIDNVFLLSLVFF